MQDGLITETRQEYQYGISPKKPLLEKKTADLLEKKAAKSQSSDMALEGLPISGIRARPWGAP